MLARSAASRPARRRYDGGIVQIKLDGGPWRGVGGLFTHGGYDGVIVHGFLKAGYLATMVEDWAGPNAFVERFRAEYRGPDYPDRTITCRGRVIRTFETVGKRAADVALWTERADGSVSTRGSATVILSDRG